MTLSLHVYHYILHFGCFHQVDIFSRLSRHWLLVAWFLLQSSFEIVAPPHAIPPMKARSSSLTSFLSPFFNIRRVDDIPLNNLQLSTVIAKQNNCGSSILVINNDKIIRNAYSNFLIRCLYIYIYVCVCVCVCVCDGHCLGSVHTP